MCVISVIIPSYNSATYLPKCLDSCLKQTFRDFEIIVVDDGSIDGTRNLLDSYLYKYENIRYIYKENEGLVCARRIGLKYAKGLFVFFIDADDYIECNTLQLLYEQSKDADVVIGDILIEHVNGKLYPFQHKNTLLYGKSFEGMLCNYLSKSVTPSLCGRLIRKNLFDRVCTPADFTIGEDVITNLLILLNNRDVRVNLLNSNLYHYIQYPTSMINAKSEKNLYRRLAFIEWIDVNIGVIKNERVNECLAKFVAIELYAFLREGGDFNMDSFSGKRLYDKYICFDILKKLPVWYVLLLVLFRHCFFFGKLYRNSFVFIRSLIN